MEELDRADILTEEDEFIATEDTSEDLAKEDTADEDAADLSIEESVFAPESEALASDGEDTEAASDEKVDYEEIMIEDLAELKDEFPELHGLGSIAELDNPLRYAALRDMGLSAREAYLASSYRSARADNRSHLKNAVPRAARGNTSGMSRSELLYARELFSELSDTEIYNLYKRVSG